MWFVFIVTIEHLLRVSDADCCLVRGTWSTGWHAPCMQPVARDQLPPWAKGWWRATASLSRGSCSPLSSGQPLVTVVFSRAVFTSLLVDILSVWNAPLTLVTVPPQPDPVLLQDEEVGRYVQPLPELQTSTEATGAQLWGLHGHFPQVWADFRGHVSESSGRGTPTKITYQETQACAHKTLHIYTHSDIKMKPLMSNYICKELITYFTCIVPCGFPRLLII